MLYILYIDHSMYNIYNIIVFMPHICSMIVNNSAMHGVLFATRNTVRIQGDTLFKDNTGPAIQVNS